jgi:VWFA-related protein
LTGLFFVASTIVRLDAQQQTPQATFRTTTRLVVQPVTVKDRDGKPVEGLTARDFTITEDGEPQDIAFVEFQRLEPEPALPSPTIRPRSFRRIAGRTTRDHLDPSGGGIRYQDRRLLVLYFDTSSMPPPDTLRAYLNARKYVETSMGPADLLAHHGIQGRRRAGTAGLHDDRARLREIIQTMIYGEDQDGDGIPDNTELGTAFGQDDAEFNIFNTDRQLSALQTAIAMLRPLPEQKALIYFASNIRLNGTTTRRSFARRSTPRSAPT